MTQKKLLAKNKIKFLKGSKYKRRLKIDVRKYLSICICIYISRMYREMKAMYMKQKRITQCFNLLKCVGKTLAP